MYFLVGSIATVTNNDSFIEPADQPPTVFILTDGSLVHKKLDDMRGDKLDQINSYQIQAFDFDHRRRRVCWVSYFEMHLCFVSHLQACKNIILFSDILFSSFMLM